MMRIHTVAIEFTWATRCDHQILAADKDQTISITLFLAMQGDHTADTLFAIDGLFDNLNTTTARQDMHTQCERFFKQHLDH